MRKVYDFTNSKPNPYLSKLKKQITIRIDDYAINYFKEQAQENSMPYQQLINLYLADCAKNKKKMNISWK